MVRRPDDCCLRITTPCPTAWIDRPGADLRLERSHSVVETASLVTGSPLSPSIRRAGFIVHDASSFMMRWKLISVDGAHLDWRILPTGAPTHNRHQSPRLTRALPPDSPQLDLMEAAAGAAEDDGNDSDVSEMSDC